MKILNFFGLALTASILISAAGCIRNDELIRGNGNLTEEERAISPFSALDVSGSYNILFSISDTLSLKVTAESNLMGIIETKVENNRLVIKTKKGFSILENQPMTLRISAPSLSEIELSGSCIFICQEIIEANNFQAELSGSSKLETGIITNTVSADISGSGSVKLTGGNSQLANFDISGSASVDAREHITQIASVKISGSGIVWLQVTNRLNVNISGSGEVNYFGNPTVTTSISGSGRVNKL